MAARSTEVLAPEPMIVLAGLRPNSAAAALAAAKAATAQPTESMTRRFTSRTTSGGRRSKLSPAA